MGRRTTQRATAADSRHRSVLACGADAASMATFVPLKAVLGTVMIYDALDRGLLASDALLVGGHHYPHCARGLLWAQACIGLGILLHGLLRLVKHTLFNMLALCGCLVSMWIHRIEPEAYFGGDLVLRWLLAWSVALPCRLARLGLVIQLALLYGVSLTHKSLSAYLWEGHAMRSMLLSEPHSLLDWQSWHLATYLSFSGIGPWLSRFAWLLELLAALGAGCYAVGELIPRAKRKPHNTTLVGVQMAAMDAAMVLHLTIIAVCRLGHFPAVTCAAHLGAHEAMNRLEATAASSACSGQWRQCLAMVLLAVTGVQVFAECFTGAAAVAHFNSLSRSAGLSQHWDMFSLPDEGALTTGRVVAFVYGRDAATGEGYELNLFTLEPRLFVPAADFGIGTLPARRRGLRSSFRWSLLEQRVLDPDRSDGAHHHDGASACALASTLRRANRLPGPAEGVELFSVVYDLPRLSRLRTVHEWMRNQELPPGVTLHDTAADPNAWGFDAQTGAWGAFPRTVLALPTVSWDCTRSAPEASSAASAFVFEEPTPTASASRTREWTDIDTATGAQTHSDVAHSDVAAPEKQAEGHRAGLVDPAEARTALNVTLPGTRQLEIPSLRDGLLSKEPWIHQRPLQFLPDELIARAVHEFKTTPLSSFTRVQCHIPIAQWVQEKAGAEHLTLQAEDIECLGALCPPAQVLLAEHGTGPNTSVGEVADGSRWNEDGCNLVARVQAVPDQCPVEGQDVSRQLAFTQSGPHVASLMNWAREVIGCSPSLDLGMAQGVRWTCPYSADVFLSSATSLTSVTFPWHTDLFDVLLIMLNGTKRMRVGGTRVGESTLLDVHLQKGHAVFIPAGHFHLGGSLQPIDSMLLSISTSPAFVPRERKLELLLGTPSFDDVADLCFLNGGGAGGGASGTRWPGRCKDPTWAARSEGIAELRGRGVTDDLLLQAP